MVQLIIVVLAFAVMAPFLVLGEFQNAIENIAVATTLETRRDGHWLAPTLQGELRTRKPPLAVWIAAAAVRPSTVEALGSQNESARAAAYCRFTFQIRWPFLLSSCVMLAMTFELGRLIGTARVGLFAAIAGGTNLLFFKYGSMVSSDTQLALWVSVANVFIARAVLRREYWIGCIGGVLALGLAFMSKGPVALLQTIVPAIAYVLWIRLRPPHEAVRILVAEPGESEPRLVEPSGFRFRAPIPWLQISIGALLFVVVSLPWYLLMLRRVPGVEKIWASEVMRSNPADFRPDPWFTNFRSFGEFSPWTVWIIVGVVIGGVELYQRRGARIVYAVLLLLLPVIVMSFFPERKDRYLLPLVPAAAVLAGFAVDRFVRGLRNLWESGTATLHWIGLAIEAIGFPLLATWKFKSVAGGHWFNPLQGVIFAAAAAVVMTTGLVLQRRRPWAIVGATCIAMVLFNAEYRLGRSESDGGTSDMRPLAELIRKRYPDARLFGEQPNGKMTPLDLSIYSSRAVLPVSRMPQVLSQSSDSRPVIMLLYQPKDAKELVPPGPEWKYFAQAARGNNSWHAFVFEPSSATRATR